ncbi:hypothetical protein A3Q56_06831, partial [Intoshia linei]
TTSNVFISFFGSKSTELNKNLYDYSKKLFRRGACDSFILFLPNDLGNIESITIWHDFSGTRPDWNVASIHVTDLTNSRIDDFIINDWIPSFGILERNVKISSIKEVESFNRNHIISGSMSNNHIWLSCIYKSAESTYTRVQRFTTCLILLLLTMMTTILFYKADENLNVQVIRLGSIVMSVTQIYVGIVSSAIIFPISLVIVALFSYSRNSPQKHSFLYTTFLSDLNVISKYIKGEMNYENALKNLKRKVNIKSKFKNAVKRIHSIQALSKNSLTKMKINQDNSIDTSIDQQIPSHSDISIDTGKRNDNINSSHLTIATNNSKSSNLNRSNSDSRKSFPISKAYKKIKSEFKKKRLMSKSSKNDDTASEHSRTLSGHSKYTTSEANAQMDQLTPPNTSTNSFIKYEEIGFSFDSNVHHDNITTQDYDKSLFFHKSTSFSLPWGFTVFAYFLALVCAGVSFWLTVEVAGVFGREKSIQWLFSFLFSFTESFLFSQPLKVMFLFYLYAILFYKLDKSTYKKRTHIRGTGRRIVTSNWIENCMNNLKKNIEHQNCQLQSYNRFLLYNKIDPDTRKSNIILSIKNRSKNKKMDNILKQLILYLFYLFILTTLTFSIRGDNEFDFQTAVNQLYLNDVGKTQFHSIVSSTEFMEWINTGLLPNLFNHKYNSYNHRFEKENLNQNYFLGPLRLRQLRVKSEIGINHYTKQEEWMNPEYQSFNVDKTHYYNGWKEHNNDSTYCDHYCYREYDNHFLETSFNFFYNLNLGGYTIDINENTLNKSIDVINKLMDNRWIDFQTRIVFVEFVIFNPSINQYALSSQFVKFTSIGGILPSFKLYTFRLNYYSGANAIAIILLEGLMLVFITYYTVKIIIQIYKERLAFWKILANWWDLINIILIYLLIAISIVKFIISNDKSYTFGKNTYRFHDFMAIILMNKMASIQIELSTCRKNHKIYFNCEKRKVNVFYLTMLDVIGKSVSVLTIILLFFSAFGILLYSMIVALGNPAFKDFTSACYTLFSHTLGKMSSGTDESGITSTSLSLLIIVFSLITVFIIYNLYITILLIAFEAKKNIKLDDDLEIISYVYSIIKDTISGLLPFLDNEEDA